MHRISTALSSRLPDLWENQYELNCYDYDRVKDELIGSDGLCEPGSVLATRPVRPVQQLHDQTG